MNANQLCLAACLLLGTTAATATPLSNPQPPQGQQNNTPKLTPKQAAENLTKELGLNAAQAKKLAKLNEDYADLIANPRFKGKPQPAVDNADTADATQGGEKSRSAKQVRADHIKKQHDKRNAYCAKLKKILTPEQYRKYTAQ